MLIFTSHELDRSLSVKCACSVGICTALYYLYYHRHRRNTIPFMKYPSGKTENFNLISKALGYLMFFFTKSILIKIYCFLLKMNNFHTRVKAAHNRELPKVFWSDGYFPLNIIRLMVITDFDTIQKAFRNPDLCARVSSAKLRF